MKNLDPIGVFDSGVGGVSVLRELVALMPQENYLYLGDVLHAPYGVRQTEQIRDLTVAGVSQLLEKGAKAVVIACNTATGAAALPLRAMYPDLPLVGIEPAIRPAVTEYPGQTVVVMATPMTLRQEKFQALTARFAAQADIVPLPCPGLMEFVERGELSGERLNGYLTALFANVAGEKIAAVVLGCTHYPFVRESIAGVLPPGTAIFDGSAGTARQMQRLLKAAGRCADAAGKGRVDFLLPKQAKKSRDLCEFLLNRP